MKNEMNNQAISRAMDEVRRIVSGADKHKSLNEAALYANLMSDQATLDFLVGKVEERSGLIRELMKLNAESGFTLLPQIPRDELGAFMAIGDLAARDPGAHELLGKIAEIDKARFMVTDASAGGLVQ